jgi:hypothetical protein
MTRGRRRTLVRLSVTLGLGLGVSALVSAREIDDPEAPSFQVASNPIIKRQSFVDRFSSDPSVAVIPDPTTGQDALVMVTSSDLETNAAGSGWPMRQTFLYTTFGSLFRDPLTATWFDHGAVLNENDLPWARKNANRLWAPDIQFYPGTGESSDELWVYAPALDPDGVTVRVGMKHATSFSGLFDSTQFMIEPSFFSVLGAPKSSDTPGNNGQDKVFVFDPGVFRDPVQQKAFLVYTDAPADQNPKKNLSFAAINPDKKSGKYLGKVGFTGLLKNHSGLNNYMEGPDLFSMWTPASSNQRQYYYLVFAVNVENNDTSNDTGYIGYAMCTPTEFASNPTSCWKFKGYIFRNQHTGRSNHVSLVQFRDTNYVFLHKADRVYDGKNRNRQVSVREFEIVDHPGLPDDGEILGVTHPTSDADVEKWPLYGTLDGTTSSLTQGFVQVADSDGGAGSADLTLSSFRNISNNPLNKGFQALYYFNVEQGQTLTVSDPGAALGRPFKLASPPVKHIDGNTWAAVLEFTGALPLGRWGTLPGTNGEVRLAYNSSSFDRSNDFSAPLGNFPLLTTRVAVFDPSNKIVDGNNQVVPNMGDRPETGNKVLRTAHKDANGRFTYLIAATTVVNEGINNQYQDTGKDTQQWFIEPVRDFRGMTIPVADQPNAFRLRNKQTGYYMTCNDVNKGSFSQPSFFVLDQALQWKWNTQIWIKEDAGDGSSRFRSAFTPSSNMPLFLTLTTNSNGDTGTQNVYVQPANNADTQKWIAESVSFKVLRTQHPDKSANGGKFTYLTAATTVVNEGINNQYLNTGLDTQQWIIEPVTNFDNFEGLPPLSAAEKARAVRLRNKRTGYYATSNDVNKGDANNPLFWLLDQQLHTPTNWATQLWIMEMFGDGSYQLRNAWIASSAPGKQLYLTLNNAKNGDTGTQDVFLQALGSSWDTQRWVIE